jgi:hypothetical protein
LTYLEHAHFNFQSYTSIKLILKNGTFWAEGMAQVVDAYLASMRPSVQTPVPPKQIKFEKALTLDTY